MQREAKEGDDEEEEEEDGDAKKVPSDDDEDNFETANPNRISNKLKKLADLDKEDGGDAAAGGSGASSSKPELTRKQREEIQRQEAKARYEKLHALGKTDEAQADLARLAIVKKQREEASKKRDQEKQGICVT